MTTPKARKPWPFLAVMLVWLVLAAAAGESGAVAALHPPLPQLLIVALTAALIVAGVAHKGLHEWVTQVSLRAVVAFHLTRFVGFLFLALYKRGALPREFAVPAGWGDIAVATLALTIVIFLPRPQSQPRLLMVWNALGFADIVGVVLTAARLAIANPTSMKALMGPPLSVVPLFIVPLVIASHVLVFWRLRIQSAPPRPPS